MSPTHDGHALPTGTVARIERFLDDWLAEHDVPGASVAVVDRGDDRDGDEVVYANGLGARDLESDAPATADTLYGVGSVAKPVTATAVLQLVERGDVALDDDLREYVPVWSDVPGDPVTVAEVLSHSSGMPRSFVALRDGIAGQEDLFRHLDGAADQRLTDRERYMYSNGGYFALGALVEAVDGRPFEEYVDAEVFDPLGMERSTFDAAAVEREDDAMTGYVRRDGELSPGPLDDDAGASGGLVSSARELTRLLRMAMHGGTVDGTRVLSEGTVEAMCRRQSPPLETWDGSDPGYGYGWEVQDFLGERLVGHRGGIFVSGGYVGFLPDRGIGVALCFNVMGQPVVSIGKGVLAVVAGEDPADAVRMLAVERAVDRVTGTYESLHGVQTATVEEGPAGTVEVALPGRDVTVSATAEDVDGPPYEFAARTGDGLRWPVTFRETDDGVEMVLSTAKWTAVLSKA